MTATKHPAAACTFTYDFAEQLGDATIASIAAVSSTPAGLIESARSISGTSVLLRWAGGSNGVDYLTTVTVTASDGSALVIEGLIEVRAGSFDAVVPLDVMKRHLRVDIDVDDDLIEDLTTSAIAHVERYIGVVLSPRVVVETFAGFGGTIRAWPVQSVTSVSYIGFGGVISELPAGSWLATIAARQTRLSPLSRWPVLAYRNAPVTVTMIAGYDDPAKVPTDIIQAIRMLVAEFYLNREAGALSEAATRALSWQIGSYRARRL